MKKQDPEGEFVEIVKRKAKERGYDEKTTDISIELAKAFSEEATKNVRRKKPKTLSNSRQHP